jgi:hypothetical protein
MLAVMPALPSLVPLLGAGAQQACTGGRCASRTPWGLNGACCANEARRRAVSKAARRSV